MEKVLFICVHNSARSQMAEAYLRKFGGDGFEVESAGFEPTKINPLVVEVMREEGIDLAQKSTQSLFEVFKRGSTFSHVVTVCDESVDEHCPVFPGVTYRLHLPFSDPSKAKGTREEKLAQVRVIRDQIKSAVLHFIDWVRAGERGEFGGHGETAILQGKA